MKKIPGLPTELQDLEWKEYINDRLISRHDSGFYVIVPKDMKESQGLFCPVCDCVVTSSEDVTACAEKKACQHCVDRYYYQNAEKWKDGWRPEISSCDHKKTILVR